MKTYLYYRGSIGSGPSDNLLRKLDEIHSKRSRTSTADSGYHSQHSTSSSSERGASRLAKDEELLSTARERLSLLQALSGGSRKGLNSRSSSSGSEYEMDDYLVSEEESYVLSRSNEFDGKITYGSGVKVGTETTKTPSVRSPSSRAPTEKAVDRYGAAGAETELRMIYAAAGGLLGFILLQLIYQAFTWVTTENEA